MKYLDKDLQRSGIDSIVELEPFILGTVNFPEWLSKLLHDKRIIMERMPYYENIGRWRITNNISTMILLDGTVLIPYKWDLNDKEWNDFVPLDKKYFEKRYELMEK